MRVSGHPGTSESRNDQSVSSASAASGPVARVCPVSRPANGSVSRKGRANSRSNSRASRSASRKATSPESATLSAVSRPATVLPWYARRSGSSPTSSTRSPWERSRTSPETTPAPGTPAKRRSMNRKSSSVAESAQPQIEQQRAMRPAERAARVAQGRMWQPHARELHIHGITDHPQPSRRVLDSYRRVRALHGQPGDVDADAPLPRGGHLQGGEPGIEVLEATHAQPPVGVVARDLEARVARLGALRLQSQDHRPVRDADVPEQDEGGRPVRTLVGTPEAQQLFDVEPAVRVLHDVDDRPAQVELEEHHPAGREVERVVAHIDFW